MKLPIIAAFLLVFVMASGAAFAQSRDKPADSKAYAFDDLPADSQPHWALADGVTEYDVRYPYISGKGHGRSDKEASQKGAVKFDENTPHGSDKTVLGVTAYVYTSSNRAADKRLLISLKSLPDEGESRFSAVILYPFMARRLLDQLSDMLRIGRKWRSEGVAKEGKKVLLSTLVGIDPAGSNLNMAIGKAVLSSDQTWSVWSDRVYFSNANLADLSKFRDSVEKAVRWLERQK